MLNMHYIISREIIQSIEMSILTSILENVHLCGEEESRVKDVHW